MSLSNRGNTALSQAPRATIWTVIRDLWDPQTNPNGYASLGVAENALMHPVLAAKIREIQSTHNLPHTSFTYGDGGLGTKRLCAAMARFLTKWLKPVHAVQPAHISVTNGCSSAIEHLSWALGNQGDGMLLGRPYYGTFPADISIRPGVEVLDVSFGKVDPLSMDAVKAYEDRILKSQKKGQRVAALMLCHPHNPLGRCYTKEVIIALMRLCQKYRVHLISDEIYALSVWDNTVDTPGEAGCPELVPFESVLSIDTTGIIDANLVHCIWGLSKDFGANGLRLGAIISQNNPDLHIALTSVSLYSYASLLTDFVASHILEDDKWTEEYIAENRKRLSKNYEFVTKFVTGKGIEYKRGVNSTFFLWVDLGTAYKKARPGREFSANITDEITGALLREKVFLASGTNFGSEEGGWFRIVFSQPQSLMKEALGRMMKAIDPEGSTIVQSKL